VQAYPILQGAHVALFEAATWLGQFLDLCALELVFTSSSVSLGAADCHVRGEMIWLPKGSRFQPIKNHSTWHLDCDSTLYTYQSKPLDPCLFPRNVYALFNWQYGVWVAVLEILVVTLILVE
jgi:hypothetical protein